MSKPSPQVIAALRRHRAQVRAYRAGVGRMPDEWRKAQDKALAPFERRWRETSNPLWVWRALRLALPLPDEHLHPAVPRQLQLRHPLPSWISDYLYRAACNMSALGIGQDFRSHAPTKPPYVNSGQELRAGYGAKRRRRQAPTDLVAAALGLTGNQRDGTSAFYRDKLEQEKEAIRERYQQLLARGEAPAEARANLLKELGRNDDSELKKVLRGMPGTKRRAAPKNGGPSAEVTPHPNADP